MTRDRRGPRKPAVTIQPGQAFGRLTAIGPAPSKRAHARQWLFRCNCGNNATYQTRLVSKGLRKSCGCLSKGDHREYAMAHKVTHGHCRAEHNLASATYRSWRAMRNRCNPATTVEGYRKRYVERGITVCERWAFFENFLADMGERPDGLTLDRYPNPDGNYEPGNCRWATWSEQNTNKGKTA